MQPSLWPRMLVIAGLVANAISRNPAAQLSEAARVAASSPDHAPRAAHPSINLKGVHGFDFLAGEWRVHHRRISAVSKQWVEFEGTCSHRSLMAGSANVEEFALDSPDGGVSRAEPARVRQERRSVVHLVARRTLSRRSARAAGAGALRE